MDGLDWTGLEWNWLIAWLVAWLIDWFIHSFIHSFILAFLVCFLACFLSSFLSFSSFIYRISRHSTSFHVISRHFMSFSLHVMSFLVFSCHFRSFYGSSCHFISFHVFPCKTTHQPPHVNRVIGFCWGVSCDPRKPLTPPEGIVRWIFFRRPPIFWDIGVLSIWARDGTLGANLIDPVDENYCCPWQLLGCCFGGELCWWGLLFRHEVDMCIMCI